MFKWGLCGLVVFLSTVLFAQRGIEEKHFQGCLLSEKYALQNRSDTVLKEAICLLQRVQVTADYYNGLSYASDADDLVVNATDSNLIIDFVYQKGILLYYTGQYKTAALNFRESIQYFKKMKMAEREAEALISMAENSRASQQYALSKFLLNQAKEVTKSHDTIDSAVVARLWHRYAALAIEGEKKTDKAIEYSMNSLAYSEPSGNKDHAATSYLELGYIYFNLADYANSEDYFLKALIEWRAINNPRSVASVLKNLTRLYIMTGRPLKSKRCLDESFALAHKYNLSGLMTELYNLKAAQYASIGDFENAYHMKDSVNRLESDIYRSQLDRELLELGKKYQNEIALQKLTYAEIGQKQAQEVAETEKMLRNVTTGALILVMAVLLLLIYYYRVAQISHASVVSKNDIIEKQNESLSEALDQKQSLYKEVHHRVKNNLQIIMSILNMQSNASKNDEVQMSLAKALQRIRSIALIHERLYQNDSLAKIQFKRYLEELVYYLKQAVTSENKQVDFEVNCEEIELNIDTAIPLGLLINEIVTNAIKYAFGESEKGKIEILFKVLKANQYLLKISDNGVGIDDAKAERRKGSFGTSLIEMLLRQLKGDVKRETDSGTLYSITFNTDEIQ